LVPTKVKAAMAATAINAAMRAGVLDSSDAGLTVDEI
jgi:hypothetical protein